MALKNPFKAVPIEIDEHYRARRAYELAQVALGERKAMLKLGALGLLGGLALGAVALLLRSQDFSWIFDQTPTQNVAETPAPLPQTMMSSWRRREPQAGDYWPACKFARVAGTAPLHRGEPGYRVELDIDQDGIACEPLPGY